MINYVLTRESRNYIPFNFSFFSENELMTDGCVTSGLEYDYDILVEAPEKMTYTEQANKRAHCRRLAWYEVWIIFNSDYREFLASWLFSKIPVYLLESLLSFYFSNFIFSKSIFVGKFIFLFNWASTEIHSNHHGPSSKLEGL